VVAAATTVILTGETLAQSTVPATSVAKSVPLTQAAIDAALAGYATRAALVNQMAARFEGDAAAMLGTSFNASAWRQDFSMRAMQQPTEVLQQALSAPNLSMAQNELFNATRLAQKIIPNTDLVLNFITPCRIVDTRFGGGGQLGPAYRLWSASAAPATIAAQGGNPAGCGTLSNALGWVLNVTVVPPPGNASPNFLTIQHDNTPIPPATASMNFVNQNISSLVVTANNAGGFEAYASAPTHVVIDLVGYTSRTANTFALDCTSGTTASESHGTTTRFYDVTPGACPTGYSMVSVSCQASGDLSVQSGGGGVDDPATANCWGTFLGSGSVLILATPYCCRVPSGL
jgi:hypothetical protein